MSISSPNYIRMTNTAIFFYHYSNLYIFLLMGQERIKSNHFSLKTLFEIHFKTTLYSIQDFDKNIHPKNRFPNI